MALFFRLNSESDTDLLILEQEIDRYVDNVNLNTPADLSREVELILSTIPPDRNNTKKRELARALGEASVQPDVFKDQIIKRYVSTSTFYNREKSWLHDPAYRKTMETCIKIYRKWDNGRAARELADRQREMYEALYNQSNSMLSKFGFLLDGTIDMASQPLYEESVDADGKTITLKPANWTQDTVNRRIEALNKLLETADKLRRSLLGMPDVLTEQHVRNEDDPKTADKLQEIERNVMDKLAHLRKPLDTAVPDDSAADEEE